MLRPRCLVRLGLLLICTLLADLALAEVSVCLTDANQDTETPTAEAQDDWDEELEARLADFTAWQPGPDEYQPTTQPTPLACWLDRTPAMLGDGFFQRAGPLRGSLLMDRLYRSGE